MRIGFPGVVVADQHRDLRLDIDHMSYEVREIVQYLHVTIVDK